MTPRELVASATVPGGGALRLLRRGKDFTIMLGGNDLMSSRMGGSEAALAVLTCARIAGRPAPRLLIGGYGMGFTLRAALETLPQEASITVAELVPEITEWARGPMADLTANCLDDPRVEVVHGDVAALIAAARNAFDAVLLDVDNGPDGLTTSGNDHLYSPEGLIEAKRALRPGGVLAIWSAWDDALFTRRLKATGMIVESVKVRARTNGKGPHHMIWLAERQ